MDGRGGYEFKSIDKIIFPEIQNENKLTSNPKETLKFICGVFFFILDFFLDLFGVSKMKKIILF